MSLRDQLQAIYDKHQTLTPQLVVAAARPKDHPLHERVFDRPVKDAAAAYYLDRAHDLIQSVKIVYREDEKGRERTVRAFHAVRTEKGHVYESAEKIAQDPFLSRLLMADMEREWKALRRRYEEFTEFWEMVRGEVSTETVAA